MSNQEDHGAAEPRKLTPAQLEKSVERLTRPHREPVKLGPLLAPSHISHDDLQKSIKHLYDDSLERRARERAEIEQQMQAAVMKDATMTSGGTISPSEEDDLVRRLYDESLESRRVRSAELEKTDNERFTATQTFKKCTAAEDKNIAERLYTGGMERERKKHIALYEKYVVAHQPRAARRTPAQLAMSADKMTAGEGHGT